MSAKRLDVRALFVVGMALALGAESAVAQQVNGVWQPQQVQPNPRRVAVATPPPQVVAVTTPTVFSTNRSNFRHARQGVVSEVQTVVLSDGTVLANFGQGLESVSSCRTVVVVAGEPRVVAGNGQVLSRPAAPTFTQPVPNQITPSQQMSSYNRMFGGSDAARASCFTRDARGRVFVNTFR